jgi:sugar lactone lactonase YvrE/enterochelin esterase-like enzyme
MRSIVVSILVAVVAFRAPANQPPPPAADYRPGPDSQRQPGVPTGKTFQFTFDQSKIFPGTSRTITVYVPAPYRADQPACVYIGLDSLGFGAPVVFDNLIHKKEMPAVIGIGVSAGQVSSIRPPTNPRFNRSFEFDSLDDRLARFLIEEILPEVERRRTPDGLPIRLSKDPNDRCVGGGSTGGIGAFTLAWERPDAFRRVFTAIGTFVGMRGGDRYPVLVRKTEPKPLRIFLQDGSQDQWGGGPELGDWWMGNQTLQRALAFAGYQERHVWGNDGHSGRHATAIFPQAMRWLWQDWPQPIQAGTSQNLFLQAILQPAEDWRLVASGFPSARGLTSDQKGDVLFRSAAQPPLHRITPGGKASPHLGIDSGAHAFAFGPDGRWYVADATGAKIVAYDAAGKAATVAEGIRGRNLLVTANGTLYVTEDDKLWLVKPNGAKVTLDSGLKQASAIAVSPDGLWLAVAEPSTGWGYSYRVEADGTVQFKQKFYVFHVPEWANGSGVRAWCMDRDGRLYAATHLGVQVFDRNGRVRCILPVPGGPVTSLCFGGPRFDTLYVTCGDKVYQRTLKVSGAPAWAPPSKLPPWGAG